MNFQLLWLDTLLVSLLWVTTLVACIGRLKRKWLRALLLFAVVVVPLALLGWFVTAAAMIKFNLKIEHSWFGYSLSLFLTFLVTTAVVLYRAARREPGFPSAAATWRRAPLGLAWLIAAMVGYMTLLNMDLAIRARCAIQSVEINSLYLATLPAITSEAQNAAPMYETAFAHLRENGEEEQVHNPPTGEHDEFDPNEPATITFLEHQATTIALLRRAAALPACRFDRDLSDPDIAAMLPVLNEERNAANVLNLHAREELAHGHASSAIADAAAILGMSRHFTQRPLIVSALVGFGIDAVGNRTLEQALPAVKSQDELAALHLEELPSMGRMFQQALRGEERWGLLLYGNLPALPQAATKDSIGRINDTRLLPSGGGPQGAFFRVFFLDSDEYLELMSTVQALAIKPYFTASDRLTETFKTQRSFGLFTTLIASSLQRTFDTCARIEAGDACAKTAVAVTRYRLDHAALPSHLSDLVPDYLEAVPSDPFDGHPLRLAIKSDRWIIYSIGPDCVDDGGVDMVKGKGDVIFTLRLDHPQATTNP